MIERPSSPFTEVVLRIIPARMTTSERQSSSESFSSSESTKRLYDVLIYTDLDIPGIRRQTAPPPSQRETIAELPFAGSERITVHWSKYQNYLAAFVEGEKAFYMMRDRLLEALSPGLQSLFKNPPMSVKPIRLWLNGDTPELDDLPWELIANLNYNRPPDQFLLVRGLPPETPAPIVPVGEKLRLALIHQPLFTPPALLDALRTLPKEIEVIEMTESPQKALERTVKEGYEIVHIVSDGIVSLAYEGILYFHGLDSQSAVSPSSFQSSVGGESQISPGELTVLLQNSRVSLLCLTEQDYSNPDLVQIGSYKVPSAYRAFTYLGGSRLALPNVVAPLGPLMDHQTNRFWGEFYKNLSETFNLSQAVTRARSENTPLPVALYLRSSLDVLFRREEHQPEVDPVHLDAALRLSRDVVSQLKAHSAMYGELPESVSEFLNSEETRQKSLSEELEPWLTSEEGVK
jgi:hypothetical protein